jgi:hypothetical protein
MKGKTKIFILVLTAAGLLFLTGSVLFGHGWEIEASEEIRGIAGTITFSRPGGFTLTTTAGQKYKLAMHPIRFLDETGLHLSADDRVELSGYLVEDTVILVTEIVKDSTVYTLLDTDELEKFGRRRREMGSIDGRYPGGRPGDPMPPRPMRRGSDGPGMWDESRYGCR